MAAVTLSPPVVRTDFRRPIAAIQDVDQRTFVPHIKRKDASVVTAVRKFCAQGNAIQFFTTINKIVEFVMRLFTTAWWVNIVTQTINGIGEIVDKFGPNHWKGIYNYLSAIDGKAALGRWKLIFIGGMSSLSTILFVESVDKWRALPHENNVMLNIKEQRCGAEEKVYRGIDLVSNTGYFSNFIVSVFTPLPHLLALSLLIGDFFNDVMALMDFFKDCRKISYTDEKALPDIGRRTGEAGFCLAREVRTKAEIERDLPPDQSNTPVVRNGVAQDIFATDDYKLSAADYRAFYDEYKLHLQISKVQRLFKFFSGMAVAFSFAIAIHFSVTVIFACATTALLLNAIFSLAVIGYEGVKMHYEIDAKLPPMVLVDEPAEGPVVVRQGQNSGLTSEQIAQLARERGVMVVNIYNSEAPGPMEGTPSGAAAAVPEEKKR